MADLSTAESHKKGPKKVRAKKVSTRIDMTPMVDLAFLLVTFFIFTSTFSKPKVMEVIVPDKKDTTKQTKVDTKTALTILLGKNNTVYYYTGLPDSLTTASLQLSNFSPNGIRKTLTTFDSTVIAYQRNLYPDKTPRGPVILIKPAPDSKYSSLVSIIDEMKITHMPTYALVDITPVEENLILKQQSQ